MAVPAPDPSTGGDFWRRLATAAVAAPLALGGVWLGGLALAALVAAAAAIMAHEWWQLAGVEPAPAALAVLTAAVVGAVVLAALGLYGFGVVMLAGAAAMGGLLAGGGWRRRLGAATAAAYVGLPCLALLWLRARPDDGLALVLWLLAVVWATDIAAYLTGRLVGGPKLAPRLSPAKTWAGLAGGLAAAVAITGVVGGLAGRGDLAAVLAAAAGLAAIAQGGDLFESWLKRRRGMKDSGTLLPGHGGLLDRVDGLIAAAPAMTMLVIASGGEVRPWP